MPIFDDLEFGQYVRNLPAASETDLARGNNMPIVSPSDVKKMGGEGVAKAGDVFTKKTESQQLVSVTMDSENKMVESIDANGKKTFYGDTEVKGNLKVGGNLELKNYEDSVTFVEVTMDSENKMVESIDANGKKTFYGDVEVKGDFISNNSNSRYYFLPEQKDIKAISDIRVLGSDNFVNKMYEPLRTKYPNYVTRKNIGKDQSGLYDMWCYEFTPEGGSWEYSVYLQGGVHGMLEQQGYAGLATLMNLIADKAATDEYDSLICMLRRKVRFIVVPIINVWEVSETAKYNRGERSTKPYAARNVNNVNLNRNWTATNCEQELLNIKALLADYNDVVFGFDCHTDPQGTPGWGSYLLPYADGVPEFFSKRLKRVCGYLYEKNPIQWTSTSKLYPAFRGPNIDYPLNEFEWQSYILGESQDYQRQSGMELTFCNGIFNDFGILSATLEHGANRFGTDCDEKELFAAVELYGNQIIEQVRNRVDLEKKINDLT